MRCPSCRKEFHPQPDESETYAFSKQKSPKVNAFSFLIQLCPSCFQPLVVYQEGLANSTHTPEYLLDVSRQEVVFPAGRAAETPEEVPEPFQRDLEEATTALEYSPKASAALSRRLLQRVLREQLGIAKRDLSQEIDAFIETSGAPSYLTDAVDAIRTVGNFAAHPLKNTNTGEIVDVEAGEAEWLLDVLESLFDFVFVQPKRLAAKRAQLNEKLAEAGKPPLKGA
jgi:hypothetical protein